MSSLKRKFNASKIIRNLKPDAKKILHPNSAPEIHPLPIFNFDARGYCLKNSWNMYNLRPVDQNATVIEYKRLFTALYKDKNNDQEVDREWSKLEFENNLLQ
jgi:hypothetical protein